MACKRGRYLFLRENKENTVVSYIKGVKYLGYSLYVNKGKYQLTVHPKSKAKMKSRLKYWQAEATVGGMKRGSRNRRSTYEDGQVLSPCQYEASLPKKLWVVKTANTYVYGMFGNSPRPEKGTSSKTESRITTHDNGDIVGLVLRRLRCSVNLIRVGFMQKKSQHRKVLGFFSMLEYLFTCRTLFCLR